MSQEDDFKEVFKKADTFNIVYDYTPKQFPQIVNEDAEDFVKGHDGKSTDFQISDLVAEQSGVAKLQKQGLEEEVEAQALERLKEVEESAYKEAYDLGLVEGTEKAFEEKREEFQSRLEQIDSLIQDFEQMRQKMLTHNEGEFLKIVNEIASRIAFKNIEGDADSIIYVIQELIKEIQDNERINIKMSQQDMDFIEELRGKLTKDLDFLKRVKIEPDEDIRPGGCIIETDFGTIDATLEQRAAKVWETLENKVPQWKEEPKDNPTKEGSGDDESTD